MTCSYIVRKNIFLNAGVKNSQTIYPIPPFIGYILTNVGSDFLDQSESAISKALGVEIYAVKHFLSQLIAQPSKSIHFMGNEIILPENLLVYSNFKCINSSYTVGSFSPTNDFFPTRPRTPLVVNFMVTEKCNTNCIYCYAKRDMKKEMLTSDIERVFQKLSKAGVANITLTGGDIFARKDWYEILCLSRKAGFSQTISTKTILSEKDIIRLKRLGVSHIQFSLDSATPHIIRKMINVRDEYVKALGTMFEMCEKHKFKISVRTVLCKFNTEPEVIKELCHFIDHFNCIENWIITPAFYSENIKEYSNYAVDNSELKNAFLLLRSVKMHIRPLFNKLNKEGYTLQKAKNTDDFVKSNQVCYANTYSMSILPSGDCTICEMLYDNKDFVLGNILEMGIEDIWNSNKALELYSPSREYTSTESACSLCKVFDKCKKGMTKRICYVDIMKVNKKRDMPDPKCPQATYNCKYIL